MPLEELQVVRMLFVSKIDNSVQPPERGGLRDRRTRFRGELAKRRRRVAEPQLVETESADHLISERDLDMAHAVDRDGRDIVLGWRGDVSSVASDRTPRDICFDGGVVRVNAQYSPNGWHAAPTPSRWIRKRTSG